MSRRTKIIIGVLIAILIVIVVALLLLFMRPGAQAPDVPGNTFVPQAPTRLPVQPASGITGQAPVNEVIPEQPDLEATIKAVAQTFAERYGSYSSQGFDGLTDITSLMSQRFQLTVNRADAQQLDPSVTGYQGVTTKAISVRITEFDLNFGQATVVVSAQRSATKGTTNNPRVYYQDLTLELIQTGDGWKIDDAVWN